jgi:hypothetical protein
MITKLADLLENECYVAQEIEISEKAIGEKGSQKRLVEFHIKARRPTIDEWQKTVSRLYGTKKK